MAPPQPPCVGGVSTRVLRRLLISGLLLAAALVLPTSASAIGQAKLTTAINAQMKAAGGSSSAYVMALDGDDVVYSLRPDKPLIPASVNKLFTTATALRLFGADTTLDTTVYADGEVDADG